ncbi:pyrophosphatase PpaX [Bacillota bacterium LX-D]|nr:pyrophosphatase PpaX [Bacillota bacterium LX-D]
MGLINAVLFDLDGTLLDTTDLILASFQHVAHKHLGRSVKKEEVLPYFGKPLIDCLENLCPGKGEELAADYRKHNLLNHDSMVKIFPEVQKTLVTLSKNNIKLGIVTSKVKSTAIRGLKLYHLEKLFDAIIGLEDTSKHKPDPEPVLLALKILGTKAENCLMVGDSPHDLASAKRAGVMTAAVKWSHFAEECVLEENPNFLLGKMSDLLGIVQNS